MVCELLFGEVRTCAAVGQCRLPVRRMTTRKDLDMDAAPAARTFPLPDLWTKVLAAQSAVGRDQIGFWPGTLRRRLSPPTAGATNAGGNNLIGNMNLRMQAMEPIGAVGNCLPGVARGKIAPA
jgi:hypothetical protein